MRWLARVDEDDDVWNALANRGRAVLSPAVTPLLAFEQAVLVRPRPVLWWRLVLLARHLTCSPRLCVPVSLSRLAACPARPERHRDSIPGLDARDCELANGTTAVGASCVGAPAS